ncbi:MAG: hypothetical protein M1827_000500 [Pycnora praestabilis]|nr:MAG: hypothetical protein M1827_000500 [Pycnora praestabilis]
MAASIYPQYPPDLFTDQFEYLLSNLKDWSIAHGLAVRPAIDFVSEEIDPSRVLATTAPVTLFPSPFPRACFDEAQVIQRAYNELYSAIARDEEWLRGIVEELVEVDDFIAKLWEVHLSVKKEGYVQDLSLGLFRSDYMVNVDPTISAAKPSIKQVEFNTIASSFGGLSSQVSELHKYLQSIHAYSPQSPPLIRKSSLPPNPTIPSLSAGLAAAHTAYGPSKSTPALPLCVLILVQTPERNVFDQRHIEYALYSTHHIPIFRLPFSQILDNTSIPSSSVSRPLIYAPPHLPYAYEVSTLYFRAGYSPTDYTTPDSWTARLHLERSAAIKCPSILTHLAGAKKIQQVLATPSSPHLSRFLPNPATAERVRATFTHIYPLDDTPAGRTAIALATSEEKAQGYVLKPQREGGGNNIYRGAIPPFLADLPETHWKAYILMEIIEPPALENAILRNGSVERGGVIGELGVYGVCLWRNGRDDSKAGGKEGEGDGEERGKDRGEVLENWEAGYLLRTKGRESEEGGVAAGFGAVDSCLLVDV